MILITIFMNENKKCNTMEEMVLTSERVQGAKILKCATVMLYMHFLSFFQSRIHAMRSWYVNFSSPYVDSSISANYMVDVDIYIDASALWSWGSIVSIATRLWAGRSGV
jgi:hypothetical protein